jgi:hypothetical protein
MGGSKGKYFIKKRGEDTVHWYKTWISGDDYVGLKDARERNPKKFPRGIVVQWQNESGRSFAVFEDEDQLERYIKNTPISERNYFESIRNGTVQKMRYDIDLTDDVAKKIQTDLCGNLVLTSVFEAIYELIYGNSQRDFFSNVRVYESCGLNADGTKYKFSAHIVLNNGYKDSIQGKMYYDRTVEKIKLNPKYIRAMNYYQDRVFCPLDPMVYSTFQQFRIMGSTKLGENRPKKLIPKIPFIGNDDVITSYDYIINPMKQGDSMEFLNSLVTVMCDYPLPHIPIPPRSESNLDMFLSDEQEDTIRSWLEEKFKGGVVIDGSMSDGSGQRCSRQHSGYCHIHDRVHNGSNGGYINCRANKSGEKIITYTCMSKSPKSDIIMGVEDDEEKEEEEEEEILLEELTPNQIERNQRFIHGGKSMKDITEATYSGVLCYSLDKTPFHTSRGNYIAYYPDDPSYDVDIIGIISRYTRTEVDEYTLGTNRFSYGTKLLPASKIDEYIAKDAIDRLYNAAKELSCLYKKSGDHIVRYDRRSHKYKRVDKTLTSKSIIIKYLGTDGDGKNPRKKTVKIPISLLFNVNGLFDYELFWQFKDPNKELKFIQLRMQLPLTFCNIAFFRGDPIPLRTIDDVNEFPGYGVVNTLDWLEKMRSGNHSISFGLGWVLTHFLNGICGGNQDRFKELLNWLAHPLINPQNQMSKKMAIIVGPRGSGKTYPFRTILKNIYGSMYTSARINNIVGKFNGLIEGKRMVIIDEPSISRSDKKDQSHSTEVFKELVTGEGYIKECKGVDALETESHHNFLILCNSAKLSFLDHECISRRTLVFETKMIGMDRNFNIATITDDSIINDPNSPDATDEDGINPAIEAQIAFNTPKVNNNEDVQRYWLHLLPIFKDKDVAEELTAYLVHWASNPANYINIPLYSQPAQEVMTKASETFVNITSRFLTSLVSQDQFPWLYGNCLPLKTKGGMYFATKSDLYEQYKLWHAKYCPGNNRIDSASEFEENIEGIVKTAAKNVFIIRDFNKVKGRSCAMVNKILQPPGYQFRCNPVLPAAPGYAPLPTNDVIQ